MKEIELDAYQSVIDVWAESVNRFRHRPVFTCAGSSLSFMETDKLSNAFASYLQHKTNLKPGDKIAVQLPNILQMPVVVYGIFKAGMVLVNINPMYTAREIKIQLEDAGVNAIVYMNMFGAEVEKAVKDYPVNYLIETCFGDLLSQPKGFLINAVLKYIKRMIKPFNLKQAVKFKKALDYGKKQAMHSVQVKPQNIAALQYTGGTTGKPKGAILSHRNLIANMLQTKEIINAVKSSGQHVLEEGYEVVIAPLPLYHIYAFTANLMVFPMIGANNVLIANPRDISTFLKVLKKTKFTGFIGLNTLFAALLARSEFKKCRFDRLKLTLSGGTGLKLSVGRKWQEVTGCIIAEGYGLTECSPVVCLSRLDKVSKVGSVGSAVGLTDLKIVDIVTGKENTNGEPGELCVRGPQVMSGYWNNPEATKQVLDDEGWLKTGDIAVISDDGLVEIVDRLKDMVLVSGFNVYPNEIEDVVSNHPKVASCAAVGVADEKTGEAVKLFIVPKTTKLTEDDIKFYCRDKLTAYKIPRHIKFRESLPMTPVGKVLRRELRNQTTIKK